MSSTVEEAPPTAQPERRRPWSLRRRIVVAVSAGAGVAILGGGLGLLVYASTYQPLTPGGFGRTAGRGYVSLTDGIDSTKFVLQASVGKQVTIEYSLTNWGSHPVRIDGLAYRTSGIDALRWAPEFSPDHVVGGKPHHDFPMTLGAHQSIALFAAVTTPKCQRGEDRYIDAVPIAWSAFDIHHVYQLPLDGNDAFLPIYLCPPASAVSRHVSPH